MKIVVMKFGGTSVGDVEKIKNVSKIISNHYTKKSFHTLKKLNFYENEFRWLIKVGVLRREVDGQGLTSKVRLTPLGRQIFAIHPTLTAKKPTFKDKFLNWIKRLI